MGSVTDMAYQLAFRMPGSIPVRAISLKQIRHRPTCLMNALGRPQRLHRLYLRVLNFCGFFQRAIIETFANLLSFHQSGSRP